MTSARVDGPQDARTPKVHASAWIGVTTPTAEAVIGRDGNTIRTMTLVRDEPLIPAGSTIRMPRKLRLLQVNVAGIDAPAEGRATLLFTATCDDEAHCTSKHAELHYVSPRGTYTLSLPPKWKSVTVQVYEEGAVEARSRVGLLFGLYAHASAPEPQLPEGVSEWHACPFPLAHGQHPWGPVSADVNAYCPGRAAGTIREDGSVAWDETPAAPDEVDAAGGAYRHALLRIARTVWLGAAESYYHDQDALTLKLPPDVARYLRERDDALTRLAQIDERDDASELARVRGQRDAARLLHAPISNYGEGQHCRTCKAAWPCPTALTLGWGPLNSADAQDEVSRQ